jgi:phage-related protein
MSNQLIEIFQQSELNKVIITTLQKYEGKMGNFTIKDEPSPIPEEIKTQMDEVINEICITLKHLNTLFIEQNITSDSTYSYVEFLCDLLPKYLLAPSFESLANLTSIEIETIVQTSMEGMDIEFMKAGLIENSFMNQTELPIEAIQEQFKEIDDGTIKDAYKTLLIKQYQLAVHTPAK